MPRRLPLLVTLALVGTGCATATAPAPAPAPRVRVDTVRLVDTVSARPAVPDTAFQAGRFDGGKMWTFEYPPLDYFREAYGFAPDSAWFARARLGTLRLPNCTASFVSARGLVLTNHHCARESVVAVTRPGETLLDTGFYAATLAAERPVDGLYVDQLIAIEDVTAEFERTPAALRDSASEAIADRIAARYGGDSAGVVVETVSLWNGARTSAYVFRRFDDVRLVMAPELALGFFGGDPDNFTYPRYALDMSFLRVYVDDRPYQPDVYFRWTQTGVRDGDPVFVIGNPGSTSRLQTMAQLAYRRDVGDQALLDFLRSRLAALRAFEREAPAQAESLDIRNQIFSLSNSEKAYTGMVQGLHDPVILARKADAERRLRAAIAQDPRLASQYGDLVAEMADVQESKRRLAADVRAFTALGAPSWTSAVLLRGIFAFQVANARRAGAPADAYAPAIERLESIAQQPPALQERLLAARLTDIARAYGDTSAFVRQLLGGLEPAARARAIVAGSVVSDSARASAAVRTNAIPLDDPALQLAAALLPRFGAYQQGIGGLNDEEAAIELALGRARFAVDGTRQPPDATFSLRIADGVVRGYPYNGTVAPAHTTFHGLYDRHRSFGSDGDWALPVRWTRPPAAFDAGTPLNFVSTADIIGGNSGSPVLSRDLEVVGVVFDGNIESLPGDYIYLPDRNRAVAVDARGMLEALQDIYGARRLVDELQGGTRR